MAGGVQSGERFVGSAELRERSARAATGLRALGVGPGSGVAILMRNDIPFIEASFATSSLGAYPVPINWHWGSEEVRYVLEDSGSTVLVAHADLLPSLEDAIPPSVHVLAVRTPPELAEAYGIDAAAHAPPAGLTDWEDFVGGHEPQQEPPVGGPVSMIYTSGTTGRPKGVRRDQPRRGNDAGRRMLSTVFGLHSGVRSLIPAPLYHSAPNSYAIAAVALGARVVLQPKFDPVDFLTAVERHRITHVQVVPTMFVRLLKLADEVRNRYSTASLEFVVHAAAPCPPDVKRAMLDWLGPVVNEYYGCTESGAVTFCYADEWLRHPGTVGRAIDGAVIRVVGENGEALPPGQTGEVYVRLTSLPDFTYQGDEAKRRAIERDGLITCGDIGYLDQDGYLYLCDRSKDMVISGGVNIYPAEIEAVLVGMEGVEDCAVFGIPDAEYGEALAAHIQPAAGSVIDAEGVRAHLRSKLAAYKVPKVVEFSEVLPREDSGKIFKRLLRDPYWSGSGRSI